MGVGVNLVLTAVPREALAAERIDVLISPDGRLDDERWARRALYRERFLLVGPRGHALPESVADLRIYGATRPFIGNTPESSDHDEAERLLRILGVAPERRIAVSSSYALVGLVAELGGWSLVPATNLWCGQAFAARLKVARVPGDMQVTRTMWAVADAGSRFPELELTATAAQAVVREHLAGGAGLRASRIGGRNRGVERGVKRFSFFGVRPLRSFGRSVRPSASEWPSPTFQP